MKKKDVKAAPKAKTVVTESNPNLKMVQIVCSILGLCALSFMIIENTRTRPIVQDSQLIQDYEKKTTHLQMIVNQKELEIIDLKQQVHRLTTDLNSTRKQVSALENLRQKQQSIQNKQQVKQPTNKSVVKKKVSKKPSKKSSQVSKKKSNSKKIVQATKPLPKKKAPPAPKRVIVDFTSEVPN